MRKAEKISEAFSPVSDDLEININRSILGKYKSIRV